MASNIDSASRGDDQPGDSDVDFDTSDDDDQDEIMSRGKEGADLNQNSQVVKSEAVKPDAAAPPAPAVAAKQNIEGFKDEGVKTQKKVAAKPHLQDMNRTRYGGQYASWIPPKEENRIPLPDALKGDNIDDVTRNGVQHPQFAESLRSVGAHIVLSNAEVAIWLSEVEELNTIEGKVTDVFEQTRDYVAKNSGTENPTSKPEDVSSLRLQLQEEKFTSSTQDGKEIQLQLEPFEIALLCDLVLRDVDEVKMLIPSIVYRFDDDHIQRMLDIISLSSAMNE